MQGSLSGSQADSSPCVESRGALITRGQAGTDDGGLVR